MTTAPERLELRLDRYDETSLAPIRDQIRGLSAEGSEQRLDQAIQRSDFRLVTAVDDARLVGYAAASRAHGVLHLDPVRLSSALSTLDADHACHALVDALLSEPERTWLHVAVPPASAPLRVLLRKGWRQIKTTHDSTHVLLSETDAQT